MLIGHQILMIKGQPLMLVSFFTTPNLISWWSNNHTLVSKSSVESTDALSHDYVLLSQTKHIELDIFLVWQKILD
ncbi:hypothetical protein CR513_00251, partial [Mucuna pruriens]